MAICKCDDSVKCVECKKCNDYLYKGFVRAREQYFRDHPNWREEIKNAKKNWREKLMNANTKRRDLFSNAR